MAIPEWKVLLLAICIVLLLLNEALWQWRWWRLDNTGAGVTSCSGNQILISNDIKTGICQPCPICSPGMTLSPPCGSMLTLDTVIECKPILTKIPRGSKRKKTEHKKSPSLKKRKRNAHHENSKDAESVGSQNVNLTAWPSLDVSGIYDEEELEDSNLSEIADINKFLSLTQDVQGMASTPTTKTSFSNAIYRWRQRRANPKFPTSKQTVPRPIARPPLWAKTWSDQPIPEQMNKRSSNITASCVLGGFLGTSLACLLPGSALVWLLLSLKKRRGWYGLNGTEQPEGEVDEMSCFNGYVDYMNATSTSYAVTSVNLKHLNLSEMPPDLDYLLVKKLDVRRRGERRYGWQKVGAAFKISKDDLEYLKIEYKRDNGSPTSTLLSILGTKGKTVSDLVNVLSSPKVKLANVASLIRRYIKEASKFQ